jgi:hypothetical protein
MQKLNKKAQGLGMLQAAVVVLIVTGLIIVFGLRIMEGVQGGFTNQSSPAAVATGEMIEGIGIIPSNASTLVWVILGGVMIGLLMFFFSRAGRGSS